jgi:hypothetical protein
MSPLGPLLMYMAFGLSNSVEQSIHHSPFGPVERGAEGGPGEGDSAATGRKSVGNRPILSINRPAQRRGGRRTESATTVKKSAELHR